METYKEIESGNKRIESQSNHLDCFLNEKLRVLQSAGLNIGQIRAKSVGGSVNYSVRTEKC